MAKKLNLLFLLIGLVFFGKMLLEYNLGAIWSDLSTVGVRFGFILLLWLSFLVADTVTWHACFSGYKGKIGFVRLLLIQAAGQSINNVAPSGNLGEITKGKYLAEYIGTSSSVSTLLIYNFIHLVGSVVLVALGTFFSLFQSQIPVYLRLLLLLSVLGLVGWVFLIQNMLNKGLVAKITNLLKRLKVPLKKPEKWIEAAQKIDQNIREFHTKFPRDFWISIGAHVVSRACSVCEVYLICGFLDKSVSWATAFFIMSVSQLLGWIFSMVPGQLGVMEQSSDALFGAMSFQPGVGFTFELVRRGRRIVQIAFGLSVMLFLFLNKSRLKEKKVLPICATHEEHSGDE